MMTREKLERAQIPACIALGVTIPILAFLLAHIGAEVMTDKIGWKITEFYLGLSCFFLCGCVLAVSLAHVAESIGGLTNSPRWQCWVFAVALDLSLITMELIRTLSEYRHLFVWVVIVAILILSAFLNVSAFLGHRLAEKGLESSSPGETVSDAEITEEDLDFSEVGVVRSGW